MATVTPSSGEGSPDRDIEKAATAAGGHVIHSNLPNEGNNNGSAANDDSDDGTASDAASIGNQRRVLSTSRLIVAFAALSAALFVSFIDQTAVSTAIPAISADLVTGASTPWIGASFLIASTSFQLVNGRLSDIFGRKACLLAALGLMATGDLACGFARTPAELFAFRAIAGVGGGGVNSVAMIIVSDITTLENRGKYQGILGAVLACANGVGPFLGGAVVEKATWRWVFWMVPMLAVPAALVILFCLPLRFEGGGDYKAKFAKIDYGGVLLNLVSVVLILIPLSGGGVTYAWNSAIFISMLTVGLVLFAGFVMYEWKIAPIPIMPLHLLGAPHCWAIYASTFFAGICYYGNFFYIPLYLQIVLKYPALTSGALILPLIIATSLASICGGQFMARVGRYMPLVVAGFALWTLGSGLTVQFDGQTPLWHLIIVLVVQGCGVGLTLQSTLIGLLVNSRSEDRAVLTGLRNFLRTVGGAFGLTASGAILSNTLNSKLSGLPYLPDGVISSLASSAYALDDLKLTDDEVSHVLDVYMQGVHYIFIFYTVCAGCSTILSAFVGNTDLHREKKAKLAAAAAEEEAARASEGEGTGSETGSSGVVEKSNV